MLISPRWKNRARRAEDRAGWAAICCWKKDGAARRGAPSAMSRATVRANTSSTTAGPTPSSAPAAATIRNCRLSVPFTPATGPRLLSSPRPDAPRRAGRAGRAVTAGTRAPPRPVLGPRHLPAEADGMAGARKPRVPAPHRPAVPFPQRRLSRRTRISSQTLASRKRKAIRRERRDGAGHRHLRSTGSPAATSPRTSGTRSSPSTWIPAGANGAGPTSTAASSR